MAAGVRAERHTPRRLLSRAAGTLDILRAWPGQRQIPFLDRDELDVLRDRRLREIVRYAATHVPRYRALADAELFDPASVAGVGDLERFPIISRQDLLEDTGAFRSRSVREADALRVRTSGSTGEPLDVLHDRRSALANIAYSERERAVDGELVGRDGYRVLALEYGGATLAEVRTFYQAAAFRPRRPPQSLIPSERGVEAAIEGLNRLRPDVVVGTGSWIEIVFAAVRDRPATHLPRLVVYGGSALTREGRELVETTLGIPVLSRYNAGEAFKIGYFCEAGDGFHLHEDLCHVELLDEDDAPVPDGDRGEVVISNLVNRGTLLLRYRLGDRARLTRAPCSCGRTSARLLDLEGKTNVIIRLPDGTPMHSRTIWGVIKRTDGVRRFQLVQHGPAAFELKLVTDDRATFDRLVTAIVPGVEQLLPGCDVETTWHAEIPVEPGTRFESIVALEAPR